MNKTVTQEIEALQASLRDKISQLRGLEEEESKEKCKEKLTLLKDTLYLVVERVVDAVQAKMKEILDPLSHLKEQI